MRIKFNQYEFFIFDYDGTIASLNVDWVKVRKDFREHFKQQLVEFDCSENVRVDEMEYLLLKNKPEIQKKIFQFRNDFENTIKHHKLIISTFHILENIQNKRNFIISNNLTSTVETGLNQLGILDRFVHILGLDKIKLPKPDISAWNVLSELQHMDRTQVLFVGDNERTDGLFSQNIGIDFYNITKSTFTIS